MLPRLTLVTQCHYLPLRVDTQTFAWSRFVCPVAIDFYATKAWYYCGTRAITVRWYLIPRWETAVSQSWNCFPSIFLSNFISHFKYSDRRWATLLAHGKHRNNSLECNCFRLGKYLLNILLHQTRLMEPFSSPLRSIHSLIGSNFLQVCLPDLPRATGRPSKIYNGEGVKSPWHITACRRRSRQCS